MSRVRSSTSLAAAVLLATCNTVFGQNYFIDTKGNDSNTGDSLAAPFLTLERALDAVRPGDTIEMRAGRYRGGTISKPGLSNAWITIRAYSNEKVTLLPWRAGRPTLYFYHKSCDEDTPNNYPCQPFYWNVEGLEIEASGARSGDDNAVKIDTPHVRLFRNNLHGSSADVIKLVHTADDVQIIENEIHHPRARPGENAQGIDIVGADRTLVARNHVHHIPSIGIYAKGNSRDTIFESNLVENTYSHGIMLGQSTDSHRLRDGKYETYDGIMRNNVVLNAGWSCFATSSSYHPRIYNNTCYQSHSQKHGAILLSNESEIKQPGTRIEILNNIIYGAPNQPVIKITSNAINDWASLKIDNNLYWTSRGEVAVKFTWRDRNLERVPFSVWQKATGQDRHSLVTDPHITTSDNLRPSSASQAINRGIPTTLVTQDFAGTTRPKNTNTIGAHEVRR